MAGPRFPIMRMPRAHVLCVCPASRYADAALSVVCTMMGTMELTHIERNLSHMSAGFGVDLWGQLCATCRPLVSVYWCRSPCCRVRRGLAQVAALTLLPRCGWIHVVRPVAKETANTSRSDTGGGVRLGRALVLPVLYPRASVAISVGVGVE